MTSLPETVQDWLPCLKLPDYTAMIPTGHIIPIVGAEIWIDGTGARYSRDAYIQRWGINPEIAWKAVKEYRASVGKKDKRVML